MYQDIYDYVVLKPEIAPGTCSSVDNITTNPLPISRKRIRFRALGVSSYVAAACGGALGRLCLTETNDGPNPIDASEFLSQGWIYVNKNNVMCSAEDAKLGKGGYGRVYRVRRADGRIFAMKEFEPTPTGRAPPEVARECEVGISLHQAPHPCIVQLHGIVLDENLGRVAKTDVPTQWQCMAILVKEGHTESY